MSTLVQENQAQLIATEQPCERPDQPADPCVMVIFGASGDLTKRKLIPALYNLAHDNFLSDEFAVIGVSRTALSHEEFQAKIASDLDQSETWKDDPALRQKLLDKLYYISGDASDPELYKKLSVLLTSVDKKHAARGNYFFYLSTDASLFSPIIHRLGESGMTREENGQWRRVIIEKPFGRDLESAKKLNLDIKEVLSEGQ
ncbi:MAG: glucose-6-phosphate dehydrogenase, partial [Pyrinomonadaceae bacterium]